MLNKLKKFGRQIHLKSPLTLLTITLLFLSTILVANQVQKNQDIRQRAQTVPTVTINIVNFQYSPGTVTVNAGTQVRWVNTTSSTPHTSTSDTQGTANSWDSNTISPGQSFTRQFNTPGTFRYHCNVHGQAMSGTIVVLAPTPTPTLIIPTPTPSRIPTATPTPLAPSFVCLGACPTAIVTPTVTPTKEPNKPTKAPTQTPTPTQRPTPTQFIPTPTPTVYTTPPPTTVPTAYNTPTLKPCAVTAQSTSQINSSQSVTNMHSMHGGGSTQKAKKGNIFERFFEFVMKLLLRLFELIFGRVVKPTPVPAIPTVTTSPVYPSITASSTVTPTVPYDITPMLTDTPYSPTPTLTPEYPTPTQTYPTFVPSPTPNPYTPTPEPCDPVPTVEPKISMDDLKYIPGNEPLKEFDLVASISGENWTFNGTVPGPEIRVQEGDHVRLNVTNLLPQNLDPVNALNSTTVHSHGIVLPASADGVPGVTQNAIKPGETYTYDYVPDNPPGTYWYHSHQFGGEQVPKGLFGPLIIDPKNSSVAYDRDYTIMYRNNSPVTNTELDALPGERVRVRLIDVREPDFSGDPVKIAVVGVPFKVIAMDGVDLNQPDPIESQLLTMGISQRMDVEFTMPATTSAVLIAEKAGIQTTTIGQGTPPTPDNLNTLPDFNFLTYGKPTRNRFMPKSTFDQTYTMTIGPDLSINGQFFPNVPSLVVKKGQLTKVTFINNSPFFHPMHLHGQFYTVLSVNGVPTTGSPIVRDALIVPPGETAEIAIYANNPGLWMFHCHIYAHAGAGLMMMNVYDNVTTPYSVEPGSGNHPQ